MKGVMTAAPACADSHGPTEGRPYDAGMATPDRGFVGRHFPYWRNSVVVMIAMLAMIYGTPRFESQALGYTYVGIVSIVTLVVLTYVKNRWHDRRVD